MTIIDNETTSVEKVPSERAKGIMLAAAAASLWSLAGLFTRAIETDTITLLFWRSVLATAWIIVFLAAREGRTTLRAISAMPWQGWLYVPLTAISMLLFLTSMRHTSIARVSIVYATVPVVTAILTYVLFRERLKPAALIAGFVVAAGVAIMSAPDGSGHLSGDLEALGMTVGFSLMTILASRYKTIPALHVTGLSTLLTALLCLPFAKPASASLTDLGLIALFALTSLAIAPALFFRGSRLLAPAEASLVGTVETPLAPLWVWIAFSETPMARTFAGGLIVLSAVIGYLYNDLRRSRLKAARNMPISRDP